MDFETQHVLHLLINRLQSGDYPISSENGTVDFPLLSALNSNTEGWIGLVCQELLDGFQYSENDVRSSVHLEKAATILIAWSAAIRLKQNNQLDIIDLLQSIPNKDRIQKKRFSEEDNEIVVEEDQKDFFEENPIEQPIWEDEIPIEYGKDSTEKIEEEKIEEEKIEEEIEKPKTFRNSEFSSEVRINHDVVASENLHEQSIQEEIQEEIQEGILENIQVEKSNIVYVKVPNIRSTLRGILKFPSDVPEQISTLGFSDGSSIDSLREIEGLEVYVPCLYRSYSILDVMLVPSPYEESVQQPVMNGISEYSMNNSLQHILENFRRSAK
jgi:hypothetical protein